eukprot:COSAG06_NODE_5370_length_3520_cov_5.050570_3_plen_311_part_00
MRSPPWAQAALGIVMLTSSAATMYIAPRALVSHADELPPCEGFLCSNRLAVIVDARSVPKYVVASFPMFIVQLLAEMAVLAATRSRPQSGAATYSLADTWSSLAAGVCSQLSGALVVGPLGLRVLPYAYVLQHYRLAPLLPTDHPGTWLATFLLVDLCYYYLHRQGHAYALFWAGHSVHHGSEHFNLSTALRQSWLHGLVSWIYYLPLAVCGVPPAVYLATSQWNLLYQFWVHTCCIRRLPAPVEYLFSTPSHHVSTQRTRSGWPGLASDLHVISLYAIVCIAARTSRSARTQELWRLLDHLGQTLWFFP